MHVFYWSYVKLESLAVSVDSCSTGRQDKAVIAEAFHFKHEEVDLSSKSSRAETDASG